MQNDNKTILATSAMPNIDRGANYLTNIFYLENGIRKLNLVIRNNIENVYAGIVDIKSMMQAIDPKSVFSTQAGEPGAVGHSVQGIKMKENTTTRTTITLMQVKQASFVHIEGGMVSASLITRSVFKFYLSDRGDGTTFVRMTSEETGTGFCEIMSSLWFLWPILFPFMPIYYCQFESILSSLLDYATIALSNYLTNARVEKTSYYNQKIVTNAVSSIPAAVEVVAEASNPSDKRTTVQELMDLKKLLDAGALTPEEYEIAKKKVLQ